MTESFHILRTDNKSNYHWVAVLGMSSFMTVIVIVPKLPECPLQERGED